jgi:hypothetical protein
LHPLVDINSKHFLKKEVDYEKIGVAARRVPYPGKLVSYSENYKL